MIEGESDKDKWKIVSNTKDKVVKKKRKKDHKEIILM